MEKAILKTIGNEQCQIDPGAYAKLYALQKMIPAFMAKQNSEGSLREDLMDTLTYGIQCIFEDALSELDHVLFEGSYFEAGETALQRQTEKIMGIAAMEKQTQIAK
ncbi:hypothetical protein BAC1_01596 [uncultured bacterium]|nr:hypothetical protein BAC1_01596 [uncultured bacterium]